MNQAVANFELSRELPFPVAVVWQAWSDPEHLKHWWGPQGCTLSVLNFEFRPGGMFHYAMDFADTPTSWGRFMYCDIVARQKMEWLNSFANKHGGIERAPFSGQCPMEIRNALTFTAQNGNTQLHLTASPYGANEVEMQFFANLNESLVQGYSGTLSQLESYLANR